MEKEQARNVVTAKVIDIILSALNLRHLDRTSVTGSTNLIKGGLNLDSIDILELIVNFEKTFTIKLKENETGAGHFRNIDSVVDFIMEKQRLEKLPLE